MLSFNGFVLPSALFVAALSLVNTSCGGGEAGPDFTKYPVEYASVEERYIKNVTLQCELPDGAATDCDWDIPVNHLIVMLDAALGFEEARGLADAAVSAVTSSGVPAERVGQIPLANLFQIQIENELANAAQALARLEQAQGVLESSAGVIHATYNFLGEARHLPMEPAGDDNSRLPNEHRRGLAATDYYQAIPIFDDLLSPADLSEVRVGIVDSGLHLGTGQFDDVTVEIATTPIEDSHPSHHGTNIAALIAADNGDGGLNGIASRILGNRLTLVVGKWNDRGFVAHFETLASLVEVLSRRVDVVNLSFGFGEYLIGTGVTLDEFLTAREEWEGVLRALSDVLFLAATANRPGILTNRNDFPAGLVLDNVITIGGIDSAHLYNRAAGSPSGPFHTIAAPATEIAVMEPGTTRITTADGTSFGTAMVTAMAAVMKSVHPDATPGEIKRFLRDSDNGWPADPSVGDVRPSLLRTVGKYMIEQGVSGATALLDQLGGNDGDPDPTGLIMNRFTPQSVTDFAVTGPRPTTQRLTGADTNMLFAPLPGINNAGGLVESISQFSVTGGDYTLGAAADTPFRLNAPYAGALINLVIGSTLSPQYAGVTYDGRIEYTGCEMTTRSLPTNWDTLGHASEEGPDAFIFIQVEGELSGTVEGADFTTTPPTSPVTYGVTAQFHTAFQLIEADASVRAYLEQHCVGGFAYAP